MLNQVVFVGRLTSDPKINEVEGRKVANITIAVPRSYKNENGEYETDFISIILFQGIAENTAEWCKKGDIVGIKGRVESYGDNNSIRIIAEKVTFLSSRKED